MTNGLSKESILNLKLEVLSFFFSLFFFFLAFSFSLSISYSEGKKIEQFPQNGKLLYYSGALICKVNSYSLKLNMCIMKTRLAPSPGALIPRTLFSAVMCLWVQGFRLSKVLFLKMKGKTFLSLFSPSFVTGSHVAQGTLKLTTQLSLTLNL